MEKSDNFYGAILMMVAMLSFVSNDALMKFAFQSLSVEQGIFIRGAIAVPLLAIIAYFRHSLFVRIDRKNWWVVGIRAFAELAATVTFLTALSKMPLANITAILQSLPLTVTMFAAIFFGEPVGWRRWTAILIGFVGVLIIVRPGGEGFNDYTVLALISVGFVTLRDAITRRLDKSVPSLFVALIAATPIWLFGGMMTAVNGWTPVDGKVFPIIIIAAIAVTSGYLFAVMAMRRGDVSFVTPFRYTGMIWAILFGFLLFGAVPDNATITGSTIVIGMGIYTFHRERVRRDAPAAGQGTGR
jgi:drug/metabolite transporter (DMT)-like permease